MSVEAAVSREITALGSKAEGSSLGETALSLARELDDDGNSATSKSMCAKAMVEVLRELRVLAPPKQEADGVTDLNARREARRARSAAAPDSARS